MSNTYGNNNNEYMTGEGGLPGMLSRVDEYFMNEALKEAVSAEKKDEVPVGAIIVYDGVIIARAHNLKETLNDATAHAEIIAITQASEAVNGWRLTDTSIYVTLEPCIMCAGALINARIGRLIFGAYDPKAGAFGSKIDVLTLKLNHSFPVTSGIMKEESSRLLSGYFSKKRSEN